MKKFDVICIGAGIANIALALKLANKPISILMLDIGNDIKHRSCPKDKIKKCIKCKPGCHITTGFGGAGCFSDCKLTFSTEVGGSLIEYLGEDSFNHYMQDTDNMFKDFGATAELNYNADFASNLEYECNKYGMRLVKSKVKHLGTDNSYKILCHMYDYLKNCENVTIHCNQTITNIDFGNKIINTLNDTYSAKYISIAVGRYGSEWLRNHCIKNGIELSNNAVDVGVRVECPRSITDKVTDNLYEFKIINYSESDNAVRTFCVNPGGHVVQENYDDCICVNGHSYSNNESLNTNFALLVTCKFTDPFNEPIQYGKNICKLTNMLADNKVMVQRLVDLKNKKRSTKDRLNRLSIKPSLYDAEPGDLRYVLPANVIDSIIETLDNLANVMPNINGKNTILYAPEVKFYSSKIKLNDKLQSDKFKDIFFIGDSSGITHGIIQAAMSGRYVADIIGMDNCF